MKHLIAMLAALTLLATPLAAQAHDGHDHPPPKSKLKKKKAQMPSGIRAFHVVSDNPAG